ncbi:MAG TPA: pyridoxal phosphate-dependent aminotransferase [Streptosporangiaceae bacterium]|nr:pyridoxal phosphate-dependent aminotransferase [Streptosporangiaceae bacterium]
MTGSDLVERVRAASARPSDLGGESLNSISLALGESTDSTPPEIVRAAVASLAAGRTRYELVTGSPRLRARIAEAFNAEGIESLNSDNVVVTHGASAGLAAAILALVNPGDVAVLPEPTYSLYADQVAMAGGRVRWVPNDVGGRPRLNQLGAAMSGARLLVMCNPSNPTGYVLAAEELTAIVALAAEHDANVIFDEAYRDVVFDGVSFASSAPLVPGNPHVLCCGTFSKSFAMTGWRLGWVLADKENADAINLVHRTINGPLSTFVQDAASSALSLPHGHLQRAVSELQVRRDLVCAYLGAMSGVEAAIPQGAFYVFPRIDRGLTSAELTSRLAKSGVLVRAGSEYGPSGEGHIRISFALNTSQLREGMERISECILQI